MNIIQKSCTNYGDRFTFKPEIIVVHISVGTLKSMDLWFNNPQSFVSAHYGVGQNGEVHQYVPETKAAWHAGRVNNPTFKFYKSGINPNLYTIGIENEGDDLKEAPETQIAVLIELIKQVAGKWNIPLDRDHIIGHYQVDGINKVNCPSSDHTIMDKIINRLAPDEIVPITCPRSRVDIIQKFLNSLK